MNTIWLYVIIAVLLWWAVFATYILCCFYQTLKDYKAFRQGMEIYTSIDCSLRSVGYTINHAWPRDKHDPPGHPDRCMLELVDAANPNSVRWIKKEYRRMALYAAVENLQTWRSEQLPFFLERTKAAKSKK